MEESFKSCQDECIKQRRRQNILTVTPSESTTSSKRSVLRKKLWAEKLALELKIAEQTYANEIECLRAEQQKRAKLLELQMKAEQSRLESEFEDAIAQEEGMSNRGDIDEVNYLQTVWTIGSRA